LNRKQSKLKAKDVGRDNLQSRTLTLEEKALEESKETMAHAQVLQD